MMRSFSGSAASASSSATERHRNDGTGLFLDLLQARRDAGLAEILLRQHVGGDLRPELRHFDVVGAKHHRAVRVADLARGHAERRCPRRETGRPWCSAARSAWFLPLFARAGARLRPRQFIPRLGLTPPVLSVFDASLTYELGPDTGTVLNAELGCPPVTGQRFTAPRQGCIPSGELTRGRNERVRRGHEQTRPDSQKAMTDSSHASSNRRQN